MRMMGRIFCFSFHHMEQLWFINIFCLYSVRLWRIVIGRWRLERYCTIRPYHLLLSRVLVYLHINSEQRSSDKSEENRKHIHIPDEYWITHTSCFSILSILIGYEPMMCGRANRIDSLRQPHPYERSQYFDIQFRYPHRNERVWSANWLDSWMFVWGRAPHSPCETLLSCHQFSRIELPVINTTVERVKPVQKTE